MPSIGQAMNDANNLIRCARNVDIAKSVKRLLCSQGGLQEHYDVIAMLLPHCGFEGECTVSHLRDAVLRDTRQSILHHINAASAPRSSARRIILLHLDAIDAASHLTVTGVHTHGFLDDCAVQEIAGADVAKLVRGYISLSMITSGHDTADAHLDMCSDEVYKDQQPPTRIHVHDRPTGSYVLRKILARDNDTARKLAAHFHCSVEELLKLNPDLCDSSNGRLSFGERGAKLRKHTEVFVADYRACFY